MYNKKKFISIKTLLSFTELSCLGRSTAEAISLVNSLIEKEVRILVIKQGLDIFKHDMSSKIIVTLFSLLGDLERDLSAQELVKAVIILNIYGIKLLFCLKKHKTAKLCKKCYNLWFKK